MNHTDDWLTVLRRIYQWQKITIGESGAETYRLTASREPTLFLKTVPLSASENLAHEARALKWLRGKLPVPELITFVTENAREYLLMRELPGINLAEAAAGANPAALVNLLAAGLRQIHAVPVADCPFDCTIPRELERMKYRVQHNRVDESDFDEIRAGRTANDLLAEVMERIPQYEDRVFTHGDYCLPNIIVTQDGHLSGFIDVGRAGTGDRYRDIALACRSIAYNWGREWIPVFAEAYGLTGIDQKKLAFYQLVDEFF